MLSYGNVNYIPKITLYISVMSLAVMFSKV